MNSPSRVAALRKPEARTSSITITSSATSAVGAAIPARMREPNASPRPTPTSATVRTPGFGYSSNARTRPSNSTAMAAAKGASFAFMNMWP